MPDFASPDVCTVPSATSEPEVMPQDMKGPPAVRPQRWQHRFDGAFAAPPESRCDVAFAPERSIGGKGDERRLHAELHKEMNFFFDHAEFTVGARGAVRLVDMLSKAVAGKSLTEAGIPKLRALVDDFRRAASPGVPLARVEAMAAEVLGKLNKLLDEKHIGPTVHTFLREDFAKAYEELKLAKAAKPAAK